VYVTHNRHPYSSPVSVLILSQEHRDSGKDGRTMVDCTTRSFRMSGPAILNSRAKGCGFFHLSRPRHRRCHGRQGSGPADPGPERTGKGHRVALPRGGFPRGHHDEGLGRASCTRTGKRWLPPAIACTSGRASCTTLRLLAGHGVPGSDRPGGTTRRSRWQAPAGPRSPALGHGKVALVEKLSVGQHAALSFVFHSCLFQ
jgi:hypothetical protein